MRFLAFGCIILWSLQAFTQGTVLLSTFASGGLDYPISDCHGRLSGPDWTIQLWAGPLGTPADQLQPFLPTTSFGPTPGYVAQVTVLVGVPGAVVTTAQLRIWNNEGGRITDYSNATVRAASPTFEAFLESLNSSPPEVPRLLTKLGNVRRLYVRSPDCPPEPESVRLFHRVQPQQLYRFGSFRLDSDLHKPEPTGRFDSSPGT